MKKTVEVQVSMTKGGDSHLALPKGSRLELRVGRLDQEENPYNPPGYVDFYGDREALVAFASALLALADPAACRDPHWHLQNGLDEGFFCDTGERVTVYCVDDWKRFGM